MQVYLLFLLFVNVLCAAYLRSITKSAAIKPAVILLNYYIYYFFRSFLIFFNLFYNTYYLLLSEEIVTFIVF